MEARLRQATGLKHCKNIRRIAKRIWKQSNYRYGAWDECLRIALRKHCEKIAYAQKLRESLRNEEREHLTQQEFKHRHAGHVGCF